MSTDELEIDEPNHIEKVALEAKRLDLASMRTLRTLMETSKNERVRKEAAEAWLEFQIEREKVNQGPSVGGNTFNLIGDDSNVRQIRERILNKLPAELPAEGEAQ